MNERLRMLLAELRRGLEELYGDRLAHVVLYGSQARGDATSDSDIDVLIVLRGEVQPGSEVMHASELVASLCLKYDTLISPVYMDEDRYLHRNGPLLRNIRREGVEL